MGSGGTELAVPTFDLPSPNIFWGKNMAPEKFSPAGGVNNLPPSYNISFFSNPSFYGKREHFEGTGKLSPRETYPLEGRCSLWENIWPFFLQRETFGSKDVYRIVFGLDGLAIRNANRCDSRESIRRKTPTLTSYTPLIKGWRVQSPCFKVFFDPPPP